MTAQITVVGNVVRDPELKFTPSGLAVASLAVAVNRKRGEEEVVSFFDVTAFGTLGENVCETTIDGSARKPNSEHFVRADSLFTRALTLAQAQNNATYISAAYSGRAQVRANLGKWTEAAADDEAADRIIEARGLRQISDTGAIDAILDEVLAANPKSVEEFRAGKEKAFNALVGQAMKATKGKANPALVNELLKKKLG